MTNQELISDTQQSNGIKSEINHHTKICYGLAEEAGWWGDKGDRVSMGLLCTKLLLIVTEIAEATEGLRKDLPDDKLPHRPMLEVELADAVIRIYDLAGKLELDLGGALVEKLQYNLSRKDHTAEHRASQGGKKF